MQFEIGALKDCDHEMEMRREYRIACLYREPILYTGTEPQTLHGKGIGWNHYRFLVAFLLFPPAFTAGARAPIPFSLRTLREASESEDRSSSSASASTGFDDGSVSLVDLKTLR